MKTFTLRTYLCVTVAAFAVFFTPTTSPADEIPVTGLQANGHGVANWNVTNNVAGVEPFRVGHHLTWLEQAVSQATGQPTNFVALYYLAWRGHDGITPGSDSALQMGVPAPADFPNLKAAMTAGGFAFVDLKTEFGVMDLKTDQSGVEWNYDANTMTETRVYSGGMLTFKLNGHDLIGGAMPNFHFTIRFNNLLDFNDDQISGITEFAFPTNRAGGAPAEVQAVAQAFLEDIANRGIRLVFDSLQPEVQNEFAHHQNARVGGFFEAQTGRIETGVGVHFANDGFNAAEIAQAPEFRVQLTATNAAAVMVDYHTENGTAIAGEDYQGVSGTLTFNPGETSKQIPVGILADNHFENTETFRIVLSNPVNAQIVERGGGGEAQGEIVDNDLPVFPMGVPEPPLGGNEICTPLIGDYNQTLPTRDQLWIAQANGGDVNIRVFAVAVNTNDNGAVGVEVRTTNHVMLGSGSTSYSVPEVSTAGLPFEKMVEVPVGVRADGDLLRIEIAMHPGQIPFTQRHYRIEATGVRWLALGSPSFAGFESDPAIWHFDVGAGEDLVVDLFTNGVPAGATSAELTLIDPMGNLHSSSTVPINAGPEVNVVGAATGLWSLRLQANDHYRLSKVSGANRSVFANWRTGAQGELIGRIDLDGNPAVGADFNVDLFQREVFGGTPTNILIETKLVTNAFFGFHPLLPAEYVVAVRPVSTNHSVPPSTTNWVFCNPAITNVYASMTIGGGGPAKDFISIRGVHGENEGSVAWNASAGSPEGGPSPTHPQPDGGTSYYWFASPDYDNIVPGSMGGGHGEAPVQGFPNTVAALQSHGRTVGDLFIRFGPANLGAHQAGVDYTINGNIETRKYQGTPGSSYRIFLGNELMLTAAMPDVNLTLDFGSIGNPNDDVISGVTTAFTPVDASGGASPAAQAVAAAILQDVGAGQLRSVFEGIQPITQTGLNANGRTGAYFSAPMGRLELCPAGGLGGDVPDLVVADAVADEGAGNISFHVSLLPAAAQAVTVDYAFSDDSATSGADYTGSAGTLNFAAGETNKVITFPVTDDFEVEINEQFFVHLSNANGAPIHRSQATGVILDNDFPDFPPIDPEFYPTNTPCICTPLAGIYRTNASEIWHMKLLGTAGLLRVAAVAVSTNDPSTVEATVYNSAGALVGSNQVSYTVPELVASGDVNHTKWVDLNITNQVAGDKLRIEVRNLPPTPLTQTHYRLHGAGVRWMSTPSPSFAGFEAEETRWRFLVLSNEHLILNYFTNNLPGVGPVDYHVIDPSGAVVQSATNAPMVLGSEIVVSNASPGLWTLAMRSMDHYRIAKTSGLDRNIYADWRTASHSELTVHVRLDGTNAVGTPVDVVLDRVNTFGGVTNLVHYRSQITSNAVAHFQNVQQGIYRISVNPMVPGLPAPAPQFEIMACDHPLTNVFDLSTGGGPGGGPPPILTLLPGAAVEPDAGQTNLLHFGVKLSHPSASPVTVDFATQNGAAHDGSDFLDVMTTVNLSPGMTMTTVAVPVLGDNVEEQLHERMNATIMNAQNAVIGSFFANGVIVDNDGTNQAAPVAFVVADGAVYEGDSGPTQVDLAVSLTRPHNLEVRVDYSTRDNSATAPSDYTVSMGTLVFPPGSTMQVVSVPVHGDIDPESDEFFWLDLSNPVNAVIDIDADAIGAGRILNDDQVQGAGPGLFAHNAMVREGDLTNVFLDFRVALFPASTNTVTVDYSTADGNAVSGVDYQPANGTLTFAPGETNKTVSVTVLPDAAFEPTELLYFNLSNSSNAVVGLPQGVGVIKDNDHPDFPVDQPLPDPLPCICTPVVGNYNSNAIHSWSTKAHGGPLDLEFALHSVNTNEVGHQAVRVYDASGALIAATNVLMDLVEVATPEYMESVMLPLGSRPPGEILRIEVELLAGPLNAHYSLKLCGARWIGTASPSFSAWEEEPTRYRFVVQGGEDLDLDIFTNGITPDVAMQVPLRLFDPTGAQVPLPGYPTTVAAGNEVHVAGAMPGIWTLEANVTNRIMGHYRLAKTSGVNRGIFFDWASGGNGVIHTKFTVNGNPPAPGTLFTLNSFRQTTGGLEPFRSGVFTNNYAFDFDPYEMLPGVYVFEAVPGDTNLGPAIWMTNLVTCMSRRTNCFDFMGPGGGTNQPPTGPALYAFNSVLREGTVTNRTMYFTVGLWPPSATTVTVDYSLAPVTASVGVDYQDTNGTLTFGPGTTNQWVPVTILSDAVFEGPEFFHMNLHNAAGAAIADPQADGIILDDDHPDFPGDNDDLLPFPAQLPCVCTPRVGHVADTNTFHAWIVRAHGGVMSMRLFGVAVNTNDPSTIVATVYDSTGAVISNPSVSYSASEAAAGGVGFEKWVDVSLGTFPAGAKLRVEVTIGAGTPSTQTHYRLKFAGARWIATSSPSFNALEHDSALWRLRVLPGDSHLNIDFFTTDTPVPATAMEYQLYNPNGVLVCQSNSLPIVAGDELSIANPMPGLWALRSETVSDHYRLAKSGGIDNALYLGWRGAAYGQLFGQVKVDGTNAVGVPFDVHLAYQYRVNGVLTNVAVEAGVTTNGMFHFEELPHGFYVVTATPQGGGISTPAPQTNVVTCDVHPNLMFQAFGTGGGSPVIVAPDRMFQEGDVNTTGFFDIFLTSASGSDVTVDYATGGGTATAGQDYQSASGTVTIPAGSTNATVPVVIIGDNAFELNKTFLLSLSNPSGATLGTGSATATIINDDRPIAARFHRIIRVQNGGPFRLEFDLGDNGAVYEIQASDNLVNWSTIGQVTGTSGNFEFTDNGSTNRMRRYYRAIAP